MVVKNIKGLSLISLSLFGLVGTFSHVSAMRAGEDQQAPRRHASAPKEQPTVKTRVSSRAMVAALKALPNTPEGRRKARRFVDLVAHAAEVSPTQKSELRALEKGLHGSKVNLTDSLSTLLKGSFARLSETSQRGILKDMAQRYADLATAATTAVSASKAEKPKATAKPVETSAPQPARATKPARAPAENAAAPVAPAPKAVRPVVTVDHMMRRYEREGVSKLLDGATPAARIPMWWPSLLATDQNLKRGFLFQKAMGGKTLYVMIPVDGLPAAATQVFQGGYGSGKKGEGLTMTMDALPNLLNVPASPLFAALDMRGPKPVQEAPSLKTRSDRLAVVLEACIRIVFNQRAKDAPYGEISQSAFFYGKSVDGKPADARQERKHMLFALLDNVLLDEATVAVPRTLKLPKVPFKA